MKCFSLKGTRSLLRKTNSVRLIVAALALSVCSVVYATPNAPGNLPGTGLGQGDPMYVVLTENGTLPTVNGQPIIQIPFSQGAPIYELPFPVHSGDLILTEPGSDGRPGIMSDVLRFLPNFGGNAESGGIGNEFQFFSDGEGSGVQDDPADTGLPYPLQRNQFSIVEPANENVIYHAGQNTYNITSDTVQTSLVPEPGSFSLLLTGGLPLLGLIRRKYIG